VFKIRPASGNWTLVEFYRGSYPACVKLHATIEKYKSGTFIGKPRPGHRYGSTVQHKGISGLHHKVLTVSRREGYEVPEYTNVPRVPQLWLYNPQGRLVSKDLGVILRRLSEATLRGTLR
jgi:hypothetical protein